MLLSYLKIAWRNLLKNKTFSLINLMGLATGLASFILISMFVLDELSYDRFHEKANRIYRIHSDILFGGSDLNVAVSSDPMGAAMQKDYPQVETFTRIYTSMGSKLIKKGTEYIEEVRVAHVDSTFFQVFSFPALAGDTRSALNEPNTVVISGAAAKKYFGTTEAVGKMVEADEGGKSLYKIMAVIEDMPSNSHFRYDFLFSMDNAPYQMGNFLSHNFHTYLLLREGADPKALERQFPTFVAKYVFPQAAQLMDLKSMDDFEKAGNKLAYSLMPLKDIHLKSNRFPELDVNGRVEYVWIFSAVALFIILLACINFMNLSTARSSGRAREVGIRKVMGTDRKSLVLQFIAESVVMVCISLAIAVGIIALALPWFNDISGKGLQFGSLFRANVIPFLLLLPVVVGFIAGIYPAFFLSRFQPITVLKGKQGTGFKKSSLRSALVVFQFATSIILMIATLLVYRQLNFIRSTNLGYDKEQLLIVHNTGAMGNNTQAFRNEVLQIPGVTAGTLSNYLPIHPSARSDNTFSKEAVMDAKNSFNQQIWDVDHDYLPVMGMQMLKGRWFSREFGTDSAAIVINETSAATLGYADPIGKKLYTTDNPREGLNQALTIIGVVKNFHFESLRQKVGPLAMRLGNSPYNAVFRVRSTDIPSLVKQIEGKWKQLGPSMAFSYRFMDEAFDSMYRAEQRMGNIGLSFAILAIFIACLGLFGLVTYMAEQRTKEIGVRKVLGASVNHIVRLMSGDFLKLVLISAAIAFPIAYLVMDRWLQDYANRISIGWWVFAAAGLATIVIAFLTVSLQAIRSAMSNPVRSLRSE